MVHFESQPNSAPSTLLKLLGGIDAQRLGVALCVLVGAGLLVSWIGSGSTSSLIMTLVFALLVMVGMLSLVGLASGLLKISPLGMVGDAQTPLLDELPEGVLVTDDQARLVYANSAYLDIAGENREHPPTIEQLFSGEVAAAEPVYRLIQAVKRGDHWQEEFRITGTLGEECDKGPKASWYRISVKPDTRFANVREAQGNILGNEENILGHKDVALGNGPANIWQIAEITRERHRQEESFGKLQEIMDYLDQAPAGFFSADHEGRVDYLNATLANWLGLDLAEAVASPPLLKEIISGTGRPFWHKRSTCPVIKVIGKPLTST